MASMPVSHSRGKPNHDATSAIDDYASKLREKYNETLTRYRDPDINKYPAAGPTAPDKAVVPFIPLKLIRVKSFKKKADAEFLLRANMKKLEYDNFKEIEIDDILKPLTDKRLRFVLIEGEPGIGKSTLAKELALRWVRKTDEFLTNYKIIILIPLRFETYQKAKVVEDLLIDVEDINAYEVMSSIKKTRGAGVLWILDGFDELPHHLRSRSTSIFIKLIKGDILPKSTVIVTSRHAAIFTLLTFLDNDSKLIILRGFGSNEILQYASKYFKNEKLASGFHSYYSRNTMIESMLYNPMTCFIMCTIFNDFILTTNKKYPSTMTAIYNYYVRVLLKRHLIDAKLIDVNDDYDMPHYLIRKIDFENRELSVIWEDFYYLSKIAYNKVLMQEYVFGKEIHNVSKLSMMDTIISFTVFDKDESSSFIHTILQEYFAAIYLVNNPDSMFTKKDIEQNSNLEVVLTFYVGLLKFIDKEVDNKTMDMIFNYKDDLERNFRNYTRSVVVGYNHGDIMGPDETPYTHLTSLMLRCMHEHDSLVYSTAFLHKKYVLSYIRYEIRTSFNLYVNITRDFEYFICGYIVAAHDITLKLEPYSPSEIIAFNKGLQSHSSVNGKIKITLKYNDKYSYDFGQNFSRMIMEVLDLPSDMVIGMHLVSFFHLSHCQQLFSKLSSLQEITFHKGYCNSNISGHPLLNLKKLKQLNIRSKIAADELLKKLTAPGQPLKQLHVVTGNESIHILKLISKESSLEELRLEISNGADAYEGMMIWCKINNSLTVINDESLATLLAEHIEVGKIQLRSFTTFVQMKNSYYTITIYSKSGSSSLHDFIKADKDNMFLMKTKHERPNQSGKFVFILSKPFSPTDQYQFFMKRVKLR